MDLGLRGKNALVTGASKGIGLAITRALVAEGAHVVAGARNTTAELQELTKAGQAHFVEVDLSTASGPAELVTAALAHGPLHVLVNNVGAVTPRLSGFLVVQHAADEAATGRFTEPREVADLVVLLASDRAGNVTGADFVIDGGFVKTL